MSKEGSPPRLYPRRHRVYKLVEDTKTAPKEKMELILTQTVESEYTTPTAVFVLDMSPILSGILEYSVPELAQVDVISCLTTIAELSSYHDYKKRE